MADGFDIHIDPEQAARLKVLADQAHMSPQDYAMLLIDRGINQTASPSINPDPAIDRAIIDHAKRSGDFKPWSEVRDGLLARHQR
ncbi:MULTISPECIES: hypothetical protein [unclassified Caulobacter]|uniref:hypothetical protein n=1 Tax=unclassified Caulobacter TaxID=2648921 RepID=UPI0007848D1C|nr:MULTISPECIES: hypothetical protein [unclassified Caulobacter]AZS22557.1 antitoxin [Caulobacter sp. FWC26]